MSLILSQCPLYAIADMKTLREFSLELLPYAESLISAGVKIIQYRDKVNNRETYFSNARELQDLAKNKDVQLIINDDSEIAAGTSNIVHLGQEDSLSGSASPEFFGRSTHNSKEIEEALKENPKPAYIGFGSIFSSSTKEDVEKSFHLVKEVVSLWPGQVVFIGGITTVNLPELLRQLPAETQNRFYFAVIRDLLQAGISTEKIAEKVREYCQIFDKWLHQ